MVKAPFCMFSHAVTSILLVRLTHLQRLSQRNAHPPRTFRKIFLTQSAATLLGIHGLRVDGVKERLDAQ